MGSEDATGEGGGGEEGIEKRSKVRNKNNDREKRRIWNLKAKRILRMKGNIQKACTYPVLFGSNSPVNHTIKWNNNLRCQDVGDLGPIRLFSLLFLLRGAAWAVLLAAGAAARLQQPFNLHKASKVTGCSVIFFKECLFSVARGGGFQLMPYGGKTW
jgi:hypothetical protein